MYRKFRKRVYKVRMERKGLMQIAVDGGAEVVVVRGCRLGCSVEIIQGK
jgi:hypothetical protein